MSQSRRICVQDIYREDPFKRCVVVAFNGDADESSYLKVAFTRRGSSSGSILPGLHASIVPFRCQEEFTLDSKLLTPSSSFLSGISAEREDGTQNECLPN